MAGSRLQRSLTVHPAKIFHTAVLAFGSFALSSTPSLVPTVILITVLLLQTNALHNRPFAKIQIGLLLFNLSVATTLANLSASTTALTSAGSSLTFSFFRSLATSAVALTPILLSTSLTQQLSSGWSRITFFPSIWAFFWMIACRISPTGRLGVWTPLYGIDGYRWMLPFTGMAGIDFVTALWASIGAEVMGNWIQGYGDDDDVIVEEIEGTGNGHTGAITSREPGDLYSDGPEEPAGSSLDVDHGHERRQTTPVTRPFISFIILSLLTIPSFYISAIPISPYTDEAELVQVACILPSMSPDEPNRSTLDRFIEETIIVASKAEILVWPEAAVAFDTHQARLSAIERIKEEAYKHNAWIGVSFQEPDPSHVGFGGKRRNGMALIGPGPIKVGDVTTGEQVFEYFKHSLVPIAESYQTVPSNSPPPFYTIPLHAPSSNKKTHPHWPGGRKAIHHIPVTSQICLDNSQPTPHLPSRPAIILAPANTWHQNIGLPMAMLASTRAEEIGANVLWCDGGSGSVSGVYGANMGGVQITQVGVGGTWIANLGLPYPFGENDDGKKARTMYAVFGDFGAFAVIVALVIGGWAVEGTTGAVNRKRLQSSGVTFGIIQAIGLSGLVMGAAGVGQTLVGAIKHVRRPESTGDEENRTQSQSTPVGHLIDADD